MIKILFILGTRPEAIKLDPIIELANQVFDIKICLTKQHQNISDYIKIKNKIIELDLTRTSSSLSELFGHIMLLLDSNQDIQKWQPDLVIVHGDTTSSLCGALYAFYKQIPICHVEAGLRTNDKNLPFPEESNRKFIDYISNIHFAPTKLNQQNLEQEGIKESVFVVGNSIIDVLNQKNTEEDLDKQNKSSTYGVVTLHRRENWDSIIDQATLAISSFATNFQVCIKYVSNHNLVLKNKVKSLIQNNPYIELYDPLNPDQFQKLIRNSTFVITDSGGIQEECVYYSKPLFIMRSSTERQEIINNRCGYLVNPSNIYDHLIAWHNNKLIFSHNPTLYGDGSTSQKIIQHIYEYFLH